MEINEIFSFRYDFGKHEKDTPANSSRMNAMFDLLTHMITSTRAEIGFSCTDYFRSIALLVFALTT